MAKSLQTWSRLDNSAKIYPMLVNKKSQNIFRLSVTLKEKVDENILLDALKMTIERFPVYKVRLMKGAFWYYLDDNHAKIKVYPMDALSFKKITDKSCGGYCFSSLSIFFHMFISFSRSLLSSAHNGLLSFPKSCERIIWRSNITFIFLLIFITAVGIEFTPDLKEILYEWGPLISLSVAIGVILVLYYKNILNTRGAS